MFILLLASFDMYKILTRSHLFISVWFHYSRGWIQKDIAAIYVEECPTYVFL